jgi:hypothetical protein
MEIELNASRIPSVPPTPTAPRGPETVAVRDESGFRGTEALSQALAQLPDRRPEVIQQAKEVVGSVKYPPDEIINRIANLLAIHLSQPGE